MSVAAALDLDGSGTVRDARIALGGVAHKPWRVAEAEDALVGRRAEAGAYGRRRKPAARGRALRDNAFKVELAPAQRATRADGHRDPRLRRPSMPDVVGSPLERVDGRAKVTGAATYTADHHFPDVAHAVVVTSAIAHGRVESVDAGAAEAVPGVLAVLTHENAPRLRGRLERDADGNTPFTRCRTRRSATPVSPSRWWWPTASSRRVRRRGVWPSATRRRHRNSASSRRGGVPSAQARVEQKPDTARGSVKCKLGRWSALRLERVYTTPLETHNPMEPHATVAHWEGPRRLMLYDSTQGLFDCRARVARIFGLRKEGCAWSRPSWAEALEAKGRYGRT